MKIRSDFVTNSSSVSFILTMCEEIVDVFKQMQNDSEKIKIIDQIKDDIKKNGTQTYLEGKDIMTKRIEFSTDEVVMEEYRETPIEEMDDSELWAYIFGEYILNDKLASVRGFGITQIETY